MTSKNTHGESHRRMFKGTAILLASRVVSAVLALLQFVLIARYFGATSTTDAFFVASVVPILFLGLVETNLALTFTPLFVELEQDGKDADAWTLAATLFKGGTLIMILYVLLTMLCAYPLAYVLAPGFDPENRQELAKLILCLAPNALAMFIGSMFATLCFIRGTFILPAITYIIAAALPLLSIVLLHGLLQIYALPVGIVSGSVLTGILLYFRFGHRHPLFRTRIKVSHPAVREMGRLMALRTFATSLAEVNTAVDRIFASRIAPGHVTHLANAHQIVIAVRRLFVVPVGRSAMPVLSRASARGDHAEVRSLVGGIIGFLGFAIIPLFVFLIGFRDEVISLVFARGAFTEAAVEFTASALMFYSIGAFSAVLNPVLTATLFSMRDSLSPLKIVCIGVVLNVLLDYLCILAFSFGGIALATSGVATAASFLLWLSLSRKTGGLNARKTLGSLGRTLLASIVMVAVAKLIDLGVQAHWQPGLFIRVMLCFGAGAIAYIPLQAVFNRKDMRKARATAQQIMNRKSGTSA